MRELLYKLPFYLSLAVSAVIAYFAGVYIDKLFDASIGIVVIPVVFLISHFLINGAILNGIVFRKAIERNTPLFEFDELHGSIRLPGESPRLIPWSDVSKIEIVTTDQGPWEEDVWWLFYLNEQEIPIDMPQGTQNHERIFDVLESFFTDVRMDRISKAMGSTSNAKFEVWSKNS